MAVDNANDLIGITRRALDAVRSMPTDTYDEKVARAVRFFEMMECLMIERVTNVGRKRPIHGRDNRAD